MPSTLPKRSQRASLPLVTGLCALLAPLALWSSAYATSPQEPPPPPPLEPEGEEARDPNAPVHGFEAWQRMAVLAGGEWHAAEGKGKPIFRRFVPGPKGACLFSEVRNKAQLENPLPEVNVIFFDPIDEEVRGIAVGANGSYSESTYHWEGDLLICRQKYHISDGLMADGQEQKRSFDLVERWRFPSDEAFHWSLFQLEEQGVSELISNDFTRQKKHTPLPPVTEEAPKPTQTIEPLAMLAGQRASQGWDLQGDWVAGARALWVERSLPNPFGEAALQVNGFHYWNPYQSQFQFIGFSQNGDLIRGQARQAGEQVLESDYRITAFTPEKTAPDQVPRAQLGESLIPLQGEKLKSTWVLAPPGEAPVVVHAELEPQGKASGKEPSRKPSQDPADAPR